MVCTGRNKKFEIRNIYIYDRLINVFILLSFIKLRTFQVDSRSPQNYNTIKRNYENY